MFLFDILPAQSMYIPVWYVHNVPTPSCGMFPPKLTYFYPKLWCVATPNFGMCFHPKLVISSMPQAVLCFPPPPPPPPPPPSCMFDSIPSCAMFTPQTGIQTGMFPPQSGQFKHAPSCINNNDNNKEDF